jgi:sugar phosphate permease
VADHEQGLASGLINTSFQVGGAITLAIVSAVVGTSNGSEFLHDSHTAVGVVTGVAALGLVSALSGLALRRRSALAVEGSGA